MFARFFPSRFKNPMELNSFESTSALPKKANNRAHTKAHCAKRSRVRLQRRLLLEGLEDRKLLATLTVTNVNDAGPGSLRDSIQVANTMPGQDVIEFQIGSGAATINVLSELPVITESLIIDGWTQPGFVDSPLIELDGSGAGASTGLIVSASQTSIRGLVINDFFFAGIFITSGTNNSVVEGCYLGTNRHGTVLEPNNAGVFILSSDGNRIGTNGDGVNDLRERNLITGALGRGSNFAAMSLQDSSDNVIAGNLIGTDVTGEFALANHQRGIDIRAGSGNVIGTNGDGFGDAVEGNVISAASESGIFLLSAHSRVAGNFIGTDDDGEIAIPNGSGVLVMSVNNTVGTNGDGLSDDLEQNVISGNSQHGIAVWADSTIIAGNFVGTNATGTAAIGNGIWGLRISASNNRVGTNADGMSDVFERNIISGNTYLGVNIQGDSRHNVVAGNYIGTDVAGAMPLGNYDGVYMDYGPSFNLIGTNGDGVNDSVEANVIAANSHFGVVIRGGNAQNNLVKGNFIGTNPNFDSGIGNLNDAVAIFEGADSNRVERNTIFGNEGFHGVVLGALAPGNSDNNIVSENTIFNFYRAIYADGDNNQIRSNTLANNSLGLLLTGNNNVVTGNVIQNHNLYGIQIEGSNNRIGGSAPADANVIALTTNAGVEVIGIGSVGNSIQGNSIHSNGGLGIDLGGNGPTSNDPDVDDDADSGPNNFQNYPVLTFAQSGANTRVIGSISSDINATYTIDFYANPIPYSANDGEGRNFLGSTSVTTNGIGEASFDTNTLVVPLGTSPFDAYITATATDSFGNTSEFSAALQTISNQSPTAVAGGPYSVVEGTNLMLDGSGSFDPEDGTSLTYEWDLDYNGIALDVNVTGVTPTVSFQDNFASRVIALRVTDSGSLSHIATTTLTVLNAPPIVGAITLPVSLVLVGTPVHTSASFTDLGVLDLHTAAWNWGDSNSSSGTVVESSGSGTVTGRHSYATAGNYTIAVTVSDHDGGQGQSQFLNVVVYDPAAVPQGSVVVYGATLVVAGTNDKDHVQIKNKDGKLDLAIRSQTFDFDGQFSGITTVYVYGYGDDDQIQMHDDVMQRAFLFGGLGKDHIRAGGGVSVISGGDGDDDLQGGDGRNVMIGGLGGDDLDGKNGEDILIAGRTNYDNNLAMLDSILTQWSGSGLYGPRVTSLSSLLNSATVTDDGESDSLAGGAGLDWFFADTDHPDKKKRDKLNDLAIGEVLVET